MRGLRSRPAAKAAVCGVVAGGVQCPSSVTARRVDSANRVMLALPRAPRPLLELRGRRAPTMGVASAVAWPLGDDVCDELVWALRRGYAVFPSALPAPPRRPLSEGAGPPLPRPFRRRRARWRGAPPFGPSPFPSTRPKSRRPGRPRLPRREALLAPHDGTAATAWPSARGLAWPSSSVFLSSQKYRVGGCAGTGRGEPTHYGTICLSIIGYTYFCSRPGRPQPAWG